MKSFAKIIGLAFAAQILFSGSQANAVVYTYPNASFPAVSGVTPGFTNAWWIPAKFPNQATSNVDFPANQNPSTIETLVEGLLGANVQLITGGAKDCGQSGFACSNGGKTGVVSMLASIFAIHLGAGELVYKYAGPINTFMLTLPDGRGMGLSNVRAFDPVPSTVPIPAGLLLLGTGLMGVVGIGRRRKPNGSKPTIL